MPSIAGLDGYRFGTGRDESKAIEDAKLRLDNVTIKGMTFKGIVGSDGTFGGASVAISQSGNVSFDGCLWTDIVSTDGLISVAMNQFQTTLGKIVPPNSVQLNLVRSNFTNIKYDGYEKRKPLVVLMCVCVLCLRQALNMISLLFSSFLVPFPFP